MKNEHGTYGGYLREFYREARYRDDLDSEPLAEWEWELLYNVPQPMPSMWVHVETHHGDTISQSGVKVDSVGWKIMRVEGVADRDGKTEWTTTLVLTMETVDSIVSIPNVRKFWTN